VIGGRTHRTQCCTSVCASTRRTLPVLGNYPHSVPLWRIQDGDDLQARRGSQPMLDGLTFWVDRASVHARVDKPSQGRKKRTVSCIVDTTDDFDR
jgi:hypothetical protein